MNEGKLKAHDHYIAKKEAAKIVMNAKGIAFKEAFEAIPDELVTSMDYNAIAERFLNGDTTTEAAPKKKGKK